MLYAQSLRGGSRGSDDDGQSHSEKDGHDHGNETAVTPSGFSLLNAGNVPWWIILSTGGAIATGAYLAGRWGCSSSSEHVPELTLTAEGKNDNTLKDRVSEADLASDELASYEAVESSSTAQESAIDQHRGSA